MNNMNFLSENNNNMSIDYGDINSIQLPSKLKINDIIDNLKNFKIGTEIKEELFYAIKILKKFKLYESVKFCSEILITITNQNNTLIINNNNNENIIQGKNLSNIFNKVNKSNKNNNNNINFSTNSDISNFNNKFLIMYEKYKNDEKNIKNILNYSSCLFDLREYLKCSNILLEYNNPKFPQAMFLYNYCQYLIISQKMQEEKLENNENLNLKYSSCNNLNKLEIQISQHSENLSPFMNYLYGIILKDLKRYNEAKFYFIKCLNELPFLWSCWIELNNILKYINNSKNIFSEIDEHWLKYFYLSNYFLEKNYESESIEILNNLLNIFPNNIYCLNSIAHAYYLLHDYELSLEIFEKLFTIDPNRYENLDTYSNILFIKENYCDLSNLAYKCFQNDKYRPETCCVIGNYYALKGEHPKAVNFFKRAIKLDNNFLPAWTLMGHEYLEMKIIPAAVESYRTAVDIDPNDYRAWYGLGQTYEIHQMYNFAIYYFINAAKAKPNDSRMWTAIGLCYEKINKNNEALKCYEKAIYFKDKEGIALFRMAILYSYLGEDDKAAICFKENLTKNVGENSIDTEEMIESCVFLAKYYKKKGQYDEAYTVLLRVKDYEGSERDEIHKLLREITNLRVSKNNINNNDIEMNSP